MRALPIRGSHFMIYGKLGRGVTRSVGYVFRFIQVMTTSRVKLSIESRHKKIIALLPKTEQGDSFGYDKRKTSFHQLIGQPKDLRCDLLSLALDDPMVDRVRKAYGNTPHHAKENPER